MPSSPPPPAPVVPTAVMKTAQPVTSATLIADIDVVLSEWRSLPSVLGSAAWHLRQKYAFQRIGSELDARLYPREVVWIAVQGLVTLPVFLLFMVALGLALGLARAGTQVPLEALLGACARVMKVGEGRQRVTAVTAPVAAAVEAAVATDAAGGAAGEGKGKGKSKGEGGATASEAPTTIVQKQQFAGKSVLPARRLVAVVDDGGGSGGCEEVFYYINGIVEQGAMTVTTSTLLEAYTHRPWNLIDNPSNGIWADIVECMFGRTLDRAEIVVAEICEEVAAQLSAGRRVVIVAHSQGGIILSNVVRALCDGDGGDVGEGGLKRLEAYYWASAADDSRGGAEGVFAEHFAAQNDFVARIGMLRYSGELARLEGSVEEKEKEKERKRNWNGNVFTLSREQPGNGHLMKEMLIPSFLAGLFGRNSVFYSKYFAPRQKGDPSPVKFLKAELTYDRIDLAPNRNLCANFVH